MKERLLIIALIGILFYQNILFSKKIALLDKHITEIEFYLRDGVCL